MINTYNTEYDICTCYQQYQVVFNLLQKWSNILVTCLGLLEGAILLLNDGYLNHLWQSLCNMAPNSQLYLTGWVANPVVRDVIWYHITWSTLIEVMARCMVIPSYCLNQCWLQVSLQVMLKITITKLFWEIIHKKYSNSQGPMGQ